MSTYQFLSLGILFLGYPAKQQKQPFNSLPHDKFKAFGDDKSNFDKIMIFCLKQSRKHSGKRKCWLPAFSLLPTIFSKGVFLMVVKSRDCVLKS